jgi:hydantoinase/carbamoylase family amidase
MPSASPRPSELTADLERLAGFSVGRAGVTRLAWSPELRAAYAWFAERCEEAGMAVEIDAAGNLIARWECGDGPAVVMGSHLDSVPEGGRFDGSLGVLGALEAVRSLRAWGVRPTRPVWVVAFMDEENTRFNTALFGSRAFCGEDVSDLGERRDADGVRLRTAMRDWDRDIEQTASARRIHEVGDYLELHIEQGPRLSEAGAQIGVVTSIVAMTGYRAEVVGEANHAGTTPMPGRRDALAGAARMALAIRDEGRTRPEHTTNVGVMTIESGSSNVIPGRCAFTIDLRAPGDSEMAELDESCRRRLRAIAREEGLELQLTQAYRMPATPMDARLARTLEAAARAEEATVMALPSGAGHDAMVLARYVPTAMVFVPSRAGVSHSPQEQTAPEDCRLGALVLARAVQALVEESSHSRPRSVGSAT